MKPSSRTVEEPGTGAHVAKDGRHGPDTHSLRQCHAMLRRTLSGAMRFSQEPNNWLHSLHCRLFPGFEAAVNPLERGADSTIDACEQRQHAQARQQRRGKPLERVLPLSCRRGGTSSPSPAGSGGNPACGVGPERPDEGNLRAKASISSLIRPCGAPSPAGRR